MLTIPYDCYLDITISASSGNRHQMTAPWRQYLGTQNGGGIIGTFAAGEQLELVTNNASVTSYATWSGDRWSIAGPNSSWTVIAVPASLGIRNHVMADNPLVYWQLVEQGGYRNSGSEDDQGQTAFDASGNGYHGTYYSLNTDLYPNAYADGPEACRGPWSHAPFLNGAGTGSTAQYIHRPTSPFSGTGDFTYEVWVWLPTDFFTFSHPYHNLMQQRTNPRSDSGLLRVGITTDPVFLTPASIFYREGSTNLITANLTAISGRAGCWSHVAAVREAGTCTLYVNGLARGSAAGGMSVTNQNLSVGGDQPDINPFLSQDEQELMYGRMAHFALFDHAVSADRIAQRWNLGCNQCGELPPLQIRGRTDEIVPGGAPLLPRFRASYQGSNMVRGGHW